MCGITGFVTFASHDLVSEHVIRRMSESLSHRGPDSSGIWIDQQSGIALGHQRLSILDLTEAGDQPMVSTSGKFVIVLNGEVYNHQEIREELEGVSERQIRWRGHSDTEIVLAAIERWGISEAVKRFVGMFAFAVWNRDDQVLHLVRDRFGEKPLYYGWQRDVFMFASEVKALRIHPSFNGEINRDALALLLRHNYIPTPYSIYNGISKLEPGVILTLSKAAPYDQTEDRYWNAHQLAGSILPESRRANESDILQRLEVLLRDTVKNQMISDVPLGVFLSGGIDSSIIASLMQAQSHRPVRTFTIGFHESKYDEAPFARAVANQLGTDHTELYISSHEAIDVIPTLPRVYDEPFSDSSQIPTVLVSQLTRKHVTVSLSGDAGDEVFGGYQRYFRASKIWRTLNVFPKEARHTFSRLILALTEYKWPYLASFGDTMSSIPLLNKVAEYLRAIGYVSANVDLENLYRQMVSHWKSPCSVVLGSKEPKTVLTDSDMWSTKLQLHERLMYLDLLSYLRDDILVKVDRAAMAASLETRVPFLDHRIVEFSWHMPSEMKIRNGKGKWALRELLKKYVPSVDFDRRKMGFAAPISSWLRGALREWAEDLLDVSRLTNEGFFEVNPIRTKWSQHLAGTHDWSYHLWDVLMFQAWLDSQKAC